MAIDRRAPPTSPMGAVGVTRELLLGAFICARVPCGGEQKKRVVTAVLVGYVQRQAHLVTHLLKGAFNLLVSLPGDPRGVRCYFFWSEICPHDVGFLSVDRNQRQGPTGA
jgi:hypothetical protein